MALAKDVPLKQKIGQMLILGFKGSELKPNDAIVQSILRQQIGGVILFDYDYPSKTYDRNIKNPSQLKKLTAALQGYSKQAALQHKNELAPLLISIDYEGGDVNRLCENYGFPKTFSAVELARETPKQVYAEAEKMAKTLQKAGVNLNFAPLIDVNVNPNNPIIGKKDRSFSSDPHKVAEYAGLFSKAYEEHGILCTYKHFPGHGSSTGDTHEGFVDVTDTWKDYELEPYRELLRQTYACPLIMTAHVVHRGLDPKGYPASLSSAMTHGLLREKLHFKGVVVSDDLQMKAITDHYTQDEAIRLAINAGADILIFCNQLSPTTQEAEPLVEKIYQDVMDGKISENRIDEAYERIMKLKRKLKNEAR
jgi:beta-N-acetylhexosaminidase